MRTKMTRRDVLRAAAAVSVAAGLPSAELLAAHKKGSKMRLGFVTYQWGRDWDLPTLIKNLETTRILGVELRTQHAHHVEPNISAEKRKEVKKRFEDSPVTILGMGTNQAFDYVDSNDLKKSIEGTKAFIKLSHDIGGSGVKVKPNKFHKEVSHEKTIEQIGKSLNIVGAFAGDYGQKIRLEVHGDLSPLPYIKQVMDIADNPNVGVCWNCNSQDLDGKGLEYNFNLVKDRFGDTAHIRELNIGDYPYQHLINLFVKMDFKGWLLLEARVMPPDRIKAMKEQLALFKKMVANAQKELA